MSKTEKEEILEVLQTFEVRWSRYMKLRREGLIEPKNLDQMADALQYMLGTCRALLLDTHPDMWLLKCGYQWVGQAAGGMLVSLEVCRVPRPCPVHHNWHEVAFCTCGDEYWVEKIKRETVAEYHGRMCMLMATHLGMDGMRRKIDRGELRYA